MKKYIPWCVIINMVCLIVANLVSGDDLWLYAALALPFGLLWVVA